MTNLNYKEILSLGAGILTVISGLYLGTTGAIGWDVALPIVLSGLAVLGIHPAVNTTPSA